MKSFGFMTYEQQNVAITWACACLAVLGAYGVLLASWVLFTRCFRCQPAPDCCICAGHKVDCHICGKRTAVLTPSPYDLAAMRKESTRRRYSL